MEASPPGTPLLQATALTLTSEPADSQLASTPPLPSSSLDQPAPSPASSALPAPAPSSLVRTSGPRTPATPPRHSASLALTSPSRVPATPRHRKVQQSLQGTKPFSKHLEPAALAKRLKERLKLPFDPDPWQLHLLSHLLRGFDAILCAGTGYGKSLIFEGLAVLAGKKKAVLVICPLKALERDQVRFSSLLFGL